VIQPRSPSHYHRKVVTPKGEGEFVPATASFTTEGWPAVFHSVVGTELSSASVIRVQLGPNPEDAAEWAQVLAEAMHKAKFVTPDVYDMLPPAKATDRLLAAARDPLAAPIVAWCNSMPNGLLRRVLKLQMQHVMAGVQPSAYVGYGYMSAVSATMSQWSAERVVLDGDHIARIPPNLPRVPCIAKTIVYVHTPGAVSTSPQKFSPQGVAHYEF
jgi:hypothetical protein